MITITITITIISLIIISSSSSSMFKINIATNNDMILDRAGLVLLLEGEVAVIDLLEIPHRGLPGGVMIIVIISSIIVLVC